MYVALTRMEGCTSWPCSQHRSVFHNLDTKAPLLAPTPVSPQKYVGGTPALVQSLVDQCLSKYCNTSRSGKAELAVKVAVAVGAVTAGEPGLNSLRNVFWSGGQGLRIVLVHVCRECKLSKAPAPSQSREA